MTEQFAKPVATLTTVDVERHAVWRYAGDEAPDETHVQPVDGLPVDVLDNAVVATKVRLADGSHVWALLGNVDISNPTRTLHFLTLSVMHRGEWFHLARYHDRDAATRGPEALAQFLNKTVDRVFPISYDISDLCARESPSLRGTITQEPVAQLPREELLNLAMP